jgi:hypothetical protein
LQTGRVQRGNVEGEEILICGINFFFLQQLAAKLQSTSESLSLGLLSMMRTARELDAQLLKVKFLLGFFN